MREAVTSHFSRTDVNSPRMAAVKSSKRLPIPPQMMESYVVEDEEESMYQMEVEVEAEAEAEQEQAVEANSLLVHFGMVEIELTSGTRRLRSCPELHRPCRSLES